MASEGISEQELTWVLNLIFQHEIVEGVGIYRTEDSCSLCCVAIKILWNFRW